MDDEVTKEVRRIKEQIAEENNWDVRKIAAAVRRNSERRARGKERSHTAAGPSPDVRKGEGSPRAQD